MRQTYVREAVMADLPVILKIYETARRFMICQGNPTQWGLTHPPKEILAGDIEKRQLYVVCTKENASVSDAGIYENGEDTDETGKEDKEAVHGVFMLFYGAEPTYAKIYDGAWLTDKPYATIHRLAGDGKTGGVFKACLDFSREKCPRIRIDTHEKNKVMQHLIEKYGFVRCGTIYVEDGSPRIAYEYPAR